MCRTIIGDYESVQIWDIHYYSIMSKFIMKVVKIILLISKETATKLNKEYGVSFGENGISATGKLNGRRKYYICENRRNMEVLKKLEK